MTTTATLSKADAPATASAKQLTLILLLHLIPGALVFVFYRAFAPLFASAGAPIKMALLLGFAGFGLPFQLYVMWRETRRRGLSLAEIIPFRQQAPWWHYLLFVPALFGWAMLVTNFAGSIAAPVKAFLTSTVPFVYPAAGAQALPALVIAMLLLKLVVDGLLNPIIEETYYRGFLLPRMRVLGIFAPLVNALFFALAHFWQPENYLLIVLYIVPLAYVAWWRRNIYFGMMTHALLNLLGTIVALSAALSK